MRFELPMPQRLKLPERGLSEDAPELRWRRMANIYKHSERRKFDTYIASITKRRSAQIQGKVKTHNAVSQSETRANGMARYLLENDLACPRGFASVSVMGAAGVQAYLNIEAVWRKDPELRYINGEWRKERIKKEYLEDVETLRKLKALGVRSLDEVLAEQRSDVMRDRLQRVYRTASCRGDFTFDDLHTGVPWPNLRRVALAMGSITEVQYSLMVPNLNLKQVQEQFSTWKTEDKILPIEGEGTRLPTRYIVSEPEAKKGIREGDLTWDEWDQTAQKRQHQREHDEAVGDAILLIAFVANEHGSEVREVIPESKLIAMGALPPVPDFAIELRDHFSVSRIACEVVGTGGGYREKSFKSAQKEAGHLLYYPPYLGGGAHFQ